MPSHKGKTSKPKALSKKSNKGDNSELVEIAAEQLARIFWEQIKYNHRKRKHDNSSSGPASQEEF